MHKAGYKLGNVDATIILQRPKLSPHKEAMRANLCRLLDADASVVNIKARLPAGSRRAIGPAGGGGATRAPSVRAGQDAREGGQPGREPEHRGARGHHAHPGGLVLDRQTRCKPHARHALLTSTAAPVHGRAQARPETQ